MPNPSNNYECPRCNYHTPRKYRMSHHFEHLKNPCPNRTGLILTNEIKSEVLKNHVYIKPVENIISPSKSISRQSPNMTLNQTIHNYNVVNSLVSSMETLEKMHLLLDHQGVRQLDFEDQLELDFQPRLDKMERDEFPTGYSLNHEGLLNLVDGVTKLEESDLQKFNILFDRTLNRVKILSCGKWDNYLEEIGIKEVIRLLKSYFFDSYELYLIKHLQGSDLKKDRFTLKEHLDVYYKFIGTFDLDPVVCTQSDKSILGFNPKDNNEYHLAEYYGNIFSDIKNSTKVAEKNKVKRTVTNIIKDNSTHNINTLNKIMFDLIKTDNDFFEQLVEKKKFPICNNY